MKKKRNMLPVMRKKYLWLTGILWLALILRLFRLGEQSLWYDEGVTWYLTQFSLPELIRWTAADIQPPLYYIILWFTTRLFGPSEFALRFPSVVFGVLAVPVMWQMGRWAGGPGSGGAGEQGRLGDKETRRQGELRIAHPGLEQSRKRVPRTTNHEPRTTNHEPRTTNYELRTANYELRTTLSAFLAALFTAVAPLMVYYSQEARMYTLLVLQASLGSYLFLRVASNKTKNKTTIAYTLVMASALYTHYFSVFLPIAHILYLAVIYVRLNKKRRSAVGGRRSSRLLKQGGGALLGIALLFMPWMPVLLARLGDDPSYWPGALKLSEVVQDVFISFAAGGKREMIFEADGLPLAIGFATLLLLSVILLMQERQGAGEPGSRGAGEQVSRGANLKNLPGPPAPRLTRFSCCYGWSSPLPLSSSFRIRRQNSTPVTPSSPGPPLL